MKFIKKFKFINRYINIILSELTLWMKLVGYLSITCKVSHSIISTSANSGRKLPSRISVVATSKVILSPTKKFQYYQKKSIRVEITTI